MTRSVKKERVPIGAIRPLTGLSERLLRGALVLDAALFLAAALFNFGLEVPLGLTTLRFADSIWQAGTGEAVIGTVLLAAALTSAHRMSWVAWAMSGLGIAFGLSSNRVQGAARELHVVMIALAVLVLVLLLTAGRYQNRRRMTGATASLEETE